MGKRITAYFVVVLFCNMLLYSCSAGTTFRVVKGQGPKIEGPKYEMVPKRIAILNFDNSAQVDSFSIVPDSELGKGRRVKMGSGEPKKRSKYKRNKKGKNEGTIVYVDKDRPDPVLPGKVAREATQTLIFKTKRFEVIDKTIFDLELQKVKRQNPRAVQPELIAARNLNLDYLVKGELTDFEISQDHNYFMVPWWVILLGLSFLIKNDNLRYRAWFYLAYFTLSRGAIGKAIRENGPGWGKEKLNIDVGLDIRIIDTRTARVAFAETETIRRQESASKMNFIAYQKSNDIHISFTNAGRLIRYSAQHIVFKLAKWIDRSAKRIPKAG